MKITSKMALLITLKSAVTHVERGKIVVDKPAEIVLVKPGTHEYKSIDHKNPMIAEQLRVARKHGKMFFDELLPSDVEKLSKMTGTPEEKARKLKSANSLKGSVLRKVKNPGYNAKRVESAGRKAHKEMVKHGRIGGNVKAPEESGENDGTSKGSRTVSRKKKD